MTNEDGDERQELLGQHRRSEDPNPVQFKTFKRRWLVLLLFSSLSFLQAVVWNTWSAVAPAVESAFPSWPAGTVAVTDNWFCVCYVLFFYPLCWALNENVKWAVRSAAALTALASCLRCLPVFAQVSDLRFLGVVHLSAFLNALAGVVYLSAPATLSATWFPPEERAMATAVGLLSNWLGVSGSLVVGQAVVTETPGENLTLFHHGDSSDLSAQPDTDLIRHQILRLLWILAIPSILLGVPAVLAFPMKPPLPPSRSSGGDRLDFWSGIKAIVRIPSAWIIALVATVPYGLYGFWLPILTDFLPKVCFVGGNEDCLDPVWVSWLAVSCNVSGCLVSFVMARVAGVFRGHLKVWIIALFVLAGISFSSMSLVALKLITFQEIGTAKTSIILSLLLGGSLITTALPLCMELAVEICYPIPEIVVTCWITFWSTLTATLFYLVFLIPEAGYAWPNAVLPCAIAVVLPAIFLIREVYNRSGEDQDVL